MKHDKLIKGDQYSIDDKGRTISLTVKEHAVNLFINPGDNLWTFDREGRLQGMYVKERNIRRTLDNRYFLKSRKLVGLDVFRSVDEIPMAEAMPDYQKGLSELHSYFSEFPEDAQSVCDRILQWDDQALRNETHRFHEVYKPISILPPDQYMALVVQITEGCSYNKCTFCNFYRDRDFRIKSLEAIIRHLNDIQGFIGEGIHLRKSIFLGDANAVIMPQKQLLEVMDTIHGYFPQLQNIYSFIDLYTGIKKDCDDFRALADSGLKRVYLGIETGNPDLLTIMNKPRLDNELYSLVASLKEGGVSVGVIFLAGIGGNTFAEKHVEDCVEVTKNLSLGQGDMVYVSEYYDANPEFRTAMENAGVDFMSRREIKRQAADLRYRLNEVTDRGVKISVYDIQQFLY